RRPPLEYVAARRRSPGTRPGVQPVSATLQRGRSRTGPRVTPSGAVVGARPVLRRGVGEALNARHVPGVASRSSLGAVDGQSGVKTEYGERRRAPPPQNLAGGALQMAVAVGFEPTVAMNHTAFRVLHLRPLGHATSPDEPAHRGYRTRTDLRNLRPCDGGHRHPCRELVRPAVVGCPPGAAPAREALLRGAGGAVQPQTQGGPASHAPVTDVPGTSPRVHHSAAWFTPARETTSPDAY